MGKLNENESNKAHLVHILFPVVSLTRTVEIYQYVLPDANINVVLKLY